MQSSEERKNYRHDDDRVVGSVNVLGPKNQRQVCYTVTSDESRFNLDSDDKRHMCESLSKTSFPALTLQRRAAFTTVAKVWDIIEYDKQSAIIFIHGIMTAQKYFHDTL
ncbi:hypothetical protein TNCV_1726731 [Trichonephila clavipes]|nr:hypothetical protein TNCV_1726731 [Trichonephila clavipes]